MEFPAFNGKVLIDCTAANTMKIRVVREGMMRDIPEWRTWDSNGDTVALFLNLIQFLGRTKTIITDPSESDPLVCDFLDVWHFASTSTDYRAIWNRWLMLPETVNAEWVIPLNANDDVRLKAPEIVQPSAPSDEQLEAQGTAGKKKLKSETPTSKP